MSIGPLVTSLWAPVPIQATGAETFHREPLIGLRPDIIDEVGGFLRGGRTVYNLGKGVPGEKPPRHLRRVHVKHLGYSPAGGMPELRESAAGYVNRRYQPRKPVSADNILITPGNQPALALTMEVLRSGTVFVEAPYYSQFRLPIRLGEHEAKLIHPPGDEQPLADAGAIGHILSSVGSPIFLTSNPRNPDGAVRSGDALAAAYAAVAGAGGVYVDDEAYSAFTMGVPEGEPTSLLSVLEDIDQSRALILHTASKNFFAPGARIGWIVGPKDWIGTLAHLMESHTTPAALQSQVGLLNFLNDPAAISAHEDYLKLTYEEKRREFLKSLAGFAEFKLIGDPRGAFFVSVELADKTLPVKDAFHFSRRLAFEKGVTSIPLNYVDGLAYKNRLRLSYGADLSTIRLALEKMREFFDELRSRPPV